MSNLRDDPSVSERNNDTRSSGCENFERDFSAHSSTEKSEGKTPLDPLVREKPLDNTKNNVQERPNTDPSQDRSVSIGQDTKDPFTTQSGGDSQDLSCHQSDPKSDFAQLIDELGPNSTDPNRCEPSKDASPLEFMKDFVQGVEDFIRNREELLQANKSKPGGIKGADKFFHCLAGCEAARRGPGGDAAAKVASYGREAFDSVKNVVAKGLSWKDSITDCKEDLAVDRIGWEAGNSGIRCSSACKDLRPRGL